MRRAMFGPGVLFVLVFPAIGLGLMALGLQGGLTLTRLLARGKVAQGKLREKAPTNVSVNRRRVYALAFDFVGADGRRHTAEQSTSSTGAFEDEPTETLLYLPEAPSTAILVDALPAPIVADADGGLRLATPSRAFRALLLPLLVTLGNGAYAIARLLR